MENVVKNLVNVGIGAVDSIKKIVDENTASLKSTIDELKTKGASNQSDTVTQVRENVDKALDGIDELKSKVDAFVEEQQAKLNETLEKVKASLPEIKVDDLKAKIDELSKNILGKKEETNDGE